MWPIVALCASADPFFGHRVELHVHLEGAFDGPYLFECARKCVHDLPASVDLLDGRSMALQEAVRVAASEQAFLAEHIYLPPTCAKLTDFLAPFPISMAIVHASVRAEGLGCINMEMGTLSK